MKGGQSSTVRHYITIVSRIMLAIVLLVLLAAASATVWVILARLWHDGPDQVSSIMHSMPEADYSLLWAAGKAAAAGQAESLYDGQHFAQYREQLFGPGLIRLDWIYPPPMIVVGLAVAQVPLLPGYFLWLILVCGISIGVLRGAGLSWGVVLLGLFGPPTWRSMVLGQYAPLAASLVMAGLLQARRAPLRAGLALSFATLKPQLGVLVPVAWLVRRNWAAFSVAAAGTLGLAAASTAVLGIGIWPAFLHGSSISSRELLESFFSGGFPINAASVFWMARSFGAPVALSYAVQGVAALVAVATVTVAARRGGEAAMTAVTVCLTLLVAPYLYASDLVGYSLVVAMLVERQPWRFVPLVLWLCPGISEIFVLYTGRQVLPLCIMLAAALAWREFGGSAGGRSGG